MLYRILQSCTDTGLTQGLPGRRQWTWSIQYILVPVHWYISYCTDCIYSTTGTIWTEDWHKQRRQDHVEFKILDLLYVLSTLHYIFQILPMQNYIWEDLRWREQVRIFNKNVKNILFILLNILASQFPWCSSARENYSVGAGDPHHGSIGVPHGSPGDQRAKPSSLFYWFPQTDFIAIFRTIDFYFCFVIKRNNMISHTIVQGV